MTEKLITATVYVLLHSLWQALFIALVLSAYIKYSKRSSSNMKYSVSFISLTAVVISSAVTFIYYIKESGLASVTEPYLTKSFSYMTGTGRGTITSWTGSFENYSGLIFCLWFTGMTVFFIRFCIDLYYADMLRKRDCRPLSEEMTELFRKLSGKMSIGKTVRFLESPIASIPAVVGYLKPVVILPLGIVMKIPSDQLEAVISHELAHIARNDFLHNLIQSIIEIVYFFNPSVIWISRMIRKERENACDDLAVKQCKDPALLARGLYSLGLLNSEMPVTVMAASGKRKNLLCRIKRIITKENDMTRTYSGFVASIIVMFLTVTVITSCSLFAGTKEEVREEKVKTVIVKDGADDDNDKMIIVKKRSDDGKEITLDVTIDKDDDDECEDGVKKEVYVTKTGDGKTVKKIIVTKDGDDCDELVLDGGKKMIFISDDNDIDMDIDVDIDLESITEALEKALETLDKKDLSDEKKAETEAKLKEALEKLKEKEFRIQAKATAAKAKAKSVTVRSEATTDGKSSAIIIEDGKAIKIDGDKMIFTDKDGKTKEIMINKENPEEMKKMLEKAGLEADVKILSDDDDVMIWTTSDGGEKEIKKMKTITMKINDDDDDIELIKKIEDKDIDELWKNLIADGIFKEKSEETRIDIDDDEIEINDKEIPAKLLDKYKKLLGVK